MFKQQEACGGKYIPVSLSFTSSSSCIMDKNSFASSVCCAVTACTSSDLRDNYLKKSCSAVSYIVEQVKHISRILTSSTTRITLCT
jgi:hypothetical protein